MTAGLAKYLDKYKYANAVSKNLWDALSSQAQLENKSVNVADIMDTWTLQMGYPLVTVSRQYDGSKKMAAAQARFLLDPKVETDASESPFAYQWDIPFTFTSGDDAEWDSSKQEIRWISRNESKAEFRVQAADSDWLVANVEQMGYYRVNYDAQNWQLIIKQLTDDHTQIDVKNRAQIIDDAFSLARAGVIGYDVAFATTKYLANETEYVPWSAAAGNLGYIDSMLSSTSSYGHFLNYIKKIAATRFQELGFDELEADAKDPMRIYLRSTLINLMCGIKDPDCLKMAHTKLRSWSGGGAAISRNIRGQVYCFGVKAGTPDDWEFIFEQFKKSNDASEKGKLLKGTACTQEPWLLNRILNISLFSDEIRKQDASSAIIYVSHNQIGRPITWDFFRSQWDVLRSQFGAGSFTFRGLVLSITSNFATEYKLAQLETFMHHHPDQGSATRAFKQAVEKTKANIDWHKQNYGKVSQWLANAKG